MRFARQRSVAFVMFLGSFAGSCALAYNTTGGFFLGGGIVQALGADCLRKFDFRSTFCEKGRLKPVLEAIPIHLVTAPNPVLIGLSALLAVRETLNVYGPILRMVEQKKHGLSKGERAVADLLLTRPEFVVRATSAEYAASAGVAEPTIFRFLRRFGMSGITTEASTSDGGWKHPKIKKPVAHRVR
jgi:hypothetical protein